MAGRGRLDEVPPIDNKRLYMLRNGRWQALQEPVNYDRPFAGISLAVSFADEYSKRYDAEVGLIPCADGGSSLADWAVSGQLYSHAVCQTLLARRISEVKGILWHQGEADSDCESAADSYGDRFMKILAALRKECGLKHTPAVAGELGSFLAGLPGGQCAYFSAVNAALADIGAFSGDIAVAGAAGLTSNGDNLHFDARSLREFGRRYFQKYLELCRNG